MRPISVLFSLLCLTLLSFTATFALNPIELDGGALKSAWDPSSGQILRLECAASPVKGVQPFEFAGPSAGAAGFELYDELEHRLYSSRQTPSQVSGWRETRLGALTRIEFSQRFGNAPFTLDIRLTGDSRGLLLEWSARLLKGTDGRHPARRNVRVSFVLPARKDLLGWAAAFPYPASIIETPRRYCYGLDEPGLVRTGLPMYTLFKPGAAGLSVIVPLDLPKVQLNLGPEPEDPSGLYVPLIPGPPSAEASASHAVKVADFGPEDVRVVRVTEMLTGLAEDRPLRFAVRLSGHAPHWRPALGALVELYPEYFRMESGMRALWGARQGANIHVSETDLQNYSRYGGTVAWLHTHFHRHGDFIPPEAVCNPDFTWFCEPYAKEYFGISVNSNRRVIDRLSDNGQAVFLYGFNMHADTVSVVQLGLAGEVTRNRDGAPTKSYHDQPVMFFSPESPFGRHQLAQMDLMLKLYPRIEGVALDNWAYGGVDYAHDDGITMIGHRPAASINFSQQRMIGAIAGKWHGAGRLVMVNKARTIESLKGADSMLSEAEGEETFAMFALMCLDRHLQPTEYSAEKDPAYAEYTLKYTFAWGGQAGGGQADPEAALAYGALMRGTRNRTWVFDPDPLSLPEGSRGQVFRIHPDSPWNPGDIVVAVVRPEVKMRERNFMDNPRIRLRLPEADRVVKAVWLAVEDWDKPLVECPVERQGRELTVRLPRLGAAGLLRLETGE